MKKEKDLFYYCKILNCLSDGQICSISKLTSQVALSEKTVRTKVDQLNDWLAQHQAGHILKKQGTGVWLAATAEEQNRIKAILETVDEDVAPELEIRNRQLIGKLLRLKPGEVITVAQLAEYLYLSSPTITNMLKAVQLWFEKRSVKIRSVRNKGISLSGDEYNYRIAIKDYLLTIMPEAMEALLADFALGIDIRRIRRIIVNAENAWRIELADSSFNMAWILTCLSLTRNWSEGEHRFKENEEENIQCYVEYSFAESIYQRIEKEFQVELPASDIVLLAILLISAKRINTILDINSENYTRQYDENLQFFVKKVIETIDSVLDAGLTKDEILAESLLIHMRSAIFRMKYSTASQESIGKYVKSEYKQTFLATWSISHLFEEQYGIQVTEDELAGITLYIQASLIRQKKDAPVSALLVSRTGLADSQLLMELIKYNVQQLSGIKIVSNHDFSLRQYPKIDLIISTVNTIPADERVVHIGERISEYDIEQIRNKVRQIKSVRKHRQFCFHNLCHQLFDIDLIFVHPKVNSKTELITMMVKKMADKGDVTEHYLASVLERENATVTSIGRGIAIPHGNMAESNEARVAVAILEEPLDWRGELVDVVFLLGIKMTSKFEIKKTKQFYKDFLMLTEHDDNLRLLKEMDSALEIYQFFIR